MVSPRRERSWVVVMRWRMQLYPPVKIAAPWFPVVALPMKMERELTRRAKAKEKQTAVSVE